MGNILQFQKKKKGSWEEELARVGKKIDADEISQFAFICKVEDTKSDTPTENHDLGYMWFGDPVFVKGLLMELSLLLSLSRKEDE